MLSTAVVTSALRVKYKHIECYTADDNVTYGMCASEDSDHPAHSCLCCRHEEFRFT